MKEFLWDRVENIAGQKGKKWLYAFSTFLTIFYKGLFLDSLPNDKSMDVTKSKAFAFNKINVAQMMISVFDKKRGKRGKCC